MWQENVKEHKKSLQAALTNFFVCLFLKRQFYILWPIREVKVEAVTKQGENLLPDMTLLKDFEIQRFFAYRMREDIEDQEVCMEKKKHNGV